MAGPARLLVTAIPNPGEPEAAQSYLASVGPLLAAAGGTAPQRMMVQKAIVGEPFGVCLVMDFPSAEAIEKLFETDEYKALIPARDKGFKQMNIMVAAGM